MYLSYSTILFVRDYAVRAKLSYYPGLSRFRRSFFVKNFPFRVSRLFSQRYKSPRRIFSARLLLFRRRVCKFISEFGEYTIYRRRIKEKRRLIASAKLYFSRARVGKAVIIKKVFIECLVEGHTVSKRVFLF